MAVTQVASYERESGAIATNATGNLTLTAAFTPAAGEVICVWFTSGHPLCVPTGAPPISGAITWTQRIGRAVTGTCPIYLWTGVAPATPTTTNPAVPYQNAATSSTGAHLVVQRFSGTTLPVTPNAVSTAAYVATTGAGGATAPITQATANSVLAWIGSDYNGITTGTPTYANADTAAQSYLYSTVIADWAAWRVSATTGAKTVGFSGFSSSAARRFMFGAVELPPTPPATYTSARTADFTSGTVPATWPVTYGGVTVVNQRLRVPATAGVTATYAGAKTAEQAAGTDHFDDFFLQATAVTGSGAGNPAPSMMWVYANSQPAGTRIGWEYNPNDGTLTAKYQVGYADAAAVALTYSAATHGWWRVRNDGANVTWQTAPDGYTWTTRRTLATPAWANGADLSATVEAYRTTGVTDFFEVDNINIAGAAPGLTWTLNTAAADAVAAGCADTPWNREAATGGGGNTAVPWPPVITTMPAGMGTGRAARFTIPNSYKRYEVSPDIRDFVAGDTLYFGDAFYLDTDGLSVTATNYQLVMQWRQEDTTGSPCMAVEVQSGHVLLTGGYGIDTASPARLSYSRTLIANAATGHRYNLVAKVTNFATTEATSTVDIWIDGVQVLTGYTVPPATVYGGGTYWKLGIYHDSVNPGGTVWHTASKIGGSYAAVDPTPGAVSATAAAVSGTRATANAVRAEAIPTSPETGTDALQQRTLSEVRLWESWLSTYGAKGFVGEFAVPALFAQWGDQPQQDQWNALLDLYLRELDRTDIGSAVWASGRNWGAGYPEGLHVGTAVGDPLTIRNATVPVVAAHPSRGPAGQALEATVTDTAAATDHVDAAAAAPTIVTDTAAASDQVDVAATVAFDAVGPAGGAGVSSTTNALSWSHPSVGTTNLVGIVAVAMGSTSTTQTAYTLSVTWGGAAATSLGKVNSANNNTYGYQQLFGIINPPSGTQTVAVSCSGTPPTLIGSSISFVGGGSFGTAVTAYGSSATAQVSVTGTSTNNMFAAGFCGGQAFGAAPTSPTVKGSLKNVTNATGAGNGASAYRAGAAGSTALTWPLTSNAWGAVGVEIIAGSGGP